MKQPFDIQRAMEAIRQVVAPFPKAELFQLQEDGYGSPFEQLVACIISIRTLDEVMGPAARRLFARARTPETVSRLTPQEIDVLIAPAMYHERKSFQIQAIAQRIVEEFGGEMPCSEEVLLSFSGVGPKCANLVLGIACDQPRIGVDTHVHRITNRWGYVLTRMPEDTMVALEAKLPREYWVEINRLLVPFGKNICVARLPKCSLCPVLEMCQQRGVTEHR